MPYPSDLKDREWEKIASYFEPQDTRGRKATHSKRSIVNAILYLVKTGCQWRMLPSDFPPWKTVYGHFSEWSKRGVWEKALDDLNSLYRRQQKKAYAKLRCD
jgi:putative transposase